MENNSPAPRASEVRPQVEVQSSEFSGAPSFNLRHRLLRVVWRLVWLLLGTWTPAPLHRWRIFLIRFFGASVPYSAFVYGSARIWYPPNLTMHKSSTLGPAVNCYCMAAVDIGAFTVVSQGAYLCTGTHDIHLPSFQIYAKPIKIGANAWVCAEAFVGPGVTIGEGAVLAARGAAFSDLEAWTVYWGNPAAIKATRTRFKRTP